jgi:hypothetical protein
LLLSLNLSKPQEKHLTRVANALIVCEGDRNLSVLNRAFWEGKPPTNGADFFRPAPWGQEDVQKPLRTFLQRW